MKRVTIGEFIGVLRAAPDAVRGAAVRGLRSAGRRLEARVVEEIDRAEAVDTGSLRNSVGHEDVEDGTIVGVDAPHAAPVENGSRPHWPPVAPLQRWVERKGLAPAGPESRRMAFMIAKKISEQGTKPRFFMKKAFGDAPRFVKEEIDAELEALARAIG